MTLDTLHDQFFGPLDKEYCKVFLLFAVLGLITLVLTVIGILAQLLMFKKKYFTPVTWAYALVGPLVFYIQNRLLYGMCLN
jgi:hypothetical protein|tara:strand:+ start:219 stop:461 length:243 start_codon:yes stop_codon:yes gene_type:complete